MFSAPQKRSRRFWTLVFLGIGADPLVAQAEETSVAALVGCYHVDPGDWDLGDWTGDPDGLPVVPASIELQARPFPRARATAPPRGHVISPPQPLQRLAVARDSSGLRIENLDVWFSPDGRLFRVVTRGDGNRLSVISWVDERERRQSRAVHTPWGFSGTPPSIALRIDPTHCDTVRDP